MLCAIIMKKNNDNTNNPYHCKSKIVCTQYYIIRAPIEQLYDYSWMGSKTHTIFRKEVLMTIKEMIIRTIKKIETSGTHHCIKY